MSEDIPHVPISVAMIVRNCAEDLDRCLASLDGEPDEIVVVNTGLDKEEGLEETTEAALHYGARVERFPWNGRFCDARNFSFQKASNDIVMWIDSDDVMIEPQRLFANARRMFGLDQTEMIMLDYDYQFDEDGHCTTVLLRERFVDRRYWSWKAPIHECLCADYNVRGARIQPHVGKIRQTRKELDFEGQRIRLLRNLEVFEKEFKEHGADVRMTFYWGSTLLGLGRLQEAIEKFNEYQAISNNDTERYQAFLQQSECYRILADFEMAKKTALAAVELAPKYPTGHLIMAEALMAENSFERAIVYADQVEALINNRHFERTHNPKALMGRPHFIKAVSYANLMRIEEADEEARKAMPYFGNDESLRVVIDQIQASLAKSNLLLSFENIRTQLINEDLEARVVQLAEMMPKVIRGDSIVARHLPKDHPSEGCPRLSIVCGMGSEMWDHRSLLNGGIGGSEEAVINMSRELLKIGWHVEVYAPTDSVTKDAGVWWYPLSMFGGDVDHFDVTIFWRGPSAPHFLGMNTRTCYLWCHDIGRKEHWTHDHAQIYDGVIVLSDYHRSLFPWVADEKIFLSANGIDPSLFVPIEKCTNEPHRMIWTSCPSRGLQNLLPWWATIRDHFKDAEIDIYYGWTPTYKDAMASSRWHAELYKRVNELAKQPGVNWHGRVAQDEINRATARAGIWGYPTEFPEIHCISALKCQAHGAVPIVTDKYALKETVQHGIKIKADMDTPQGQKLWCDHVLEMMKNPWPKERRRQMIDWARRQTWARLAKEWDTRFRLDMEGSEYKVLQRGSVPKSRSALCSTPR